MAFIYKAILECDNCGFRREGEVIVYRDNIKINKVVDDEGKWICCELDHNLTFCSKECKHQYLSGTFKIKRLPILKHEESL